MIRRAFLIACACAVSSLLAPTADAENIKITSSVWPPYIDDKVQRNGFAIALVSRALERAGYQTSVVIGPWPDSLHATEKGDYDVYCGVWYTDTRAEALAFSEPFIENRISFVKKSDSDFRFRSRDDLVGLRIGIVDDYAYREQAYDTTGIEIAISGSVNENIKRLLSGDIDLALADRRVALYEINELSAAKQFTVLPQTVNTRGLRIAVSKKRADYREIVSAFERSIAAMRADGSFNAILATYRVSD